MLWKQNGNRIVPESNVYFRHPMNSTYTAFIVRLLPGHVNSNSTFECAIFNRDSQTTEVSNSYVVYVTS